MSYQIGIDVGTTYTAAAIYKAGKAEIFSLGQKTASIASVVLRKEDDSIITGDAALRKALHAPERLAREFKRRLGDSAPFMLGGSPISAEALTAEMLKTVLEAIVTQEGGQPTHIAITHPVTWTKFKKDLLAQAVNLAGLDKEKVSYLTEPQAAAISYISNEKLPEAAKVAVYDLGGGTFDAAVLERTKDGFTVLGKPEGIGHLGGVDFDAAVYNHVVKHLGNDIAELDYDDPAAIKAIARLKRDCVEAKEALSSDTDTVIPVFLPNKQTEVRMTRKEFEDACRPPLQSSIESLQRALQSAGVSADDITKILLVGGSSRIPLVSQLVASQMGVPVAIDTHPKHSVALGAAHWAGKSSVLTALASAPAVAAKEDTAPVAGQDGEPSTNASAADASTAKPTIAPPPPADSFRSSLDKVKEVTKPTEKAGNSGLPAIAISEPAVNMKQAATETVEATKVYKPKTQPYQPAKRAPYKSTAKSKKSKAGLVSTLVVVGLGVFALGAGAILMQSDILKPKDQDQGKETITTVAEEDSNDSDSLPADEESEFVDDSFTPAAPITKEQPTQTTTPAPTTSPSTTEEKGTTTIDETVTTIEDEESTTTEDEPVETTASPPPTTVDIPATTPFLTLDLRPNF